MAEQVEKMFSDGKYKAVLVAFKFNALVYSAVGGTIRTYRKDQRRQFFIFGPWIENWVEDKVDGLAVGCRYFGGVSNLVNLDGRQSSRNSSVCDERKWAVGIGVSIDASPTTGGPDFPTTTPSGGAKLEISGVMAQGSATRGGETLQLGPVSAGRVIP